MLLAAQTCSGAAVDVHPLQPMKFDYGLFSKFLRKVETTNVTYIAAFQRDSSGSKLFVSYSTGEQGTERHNAAVFEAGGVRILRDIERAWFGDDGQPVRWFEENRYFFKGGKSISIPPPPALPPIYLRGVHGGDLTLALFPEIKKCIVSGFRDPEKPLVSLPGEGNNSLGYATSRELYIFDHAPAAGNKNATLFRYLKDNSAYKLMERLEFPWVIWIEDFDVENGNILATASGGFTVNYYLYNIRTKSKSRVALNRGYMLLLQPKLIDSLKKLLHDSKSTAQVQHWEKH
jgi:hypothetical protein